jgi:putative pyruvate formate lyase activating enzyme
MQTFTRLSHRILPQTHNHISHTPLILKRFIGIPPAFLLDDYIPRYNLLSSVDSSKKRSLAYAHLRECNLCPRKCGVNRYEKTGICLIGAQTAKVNVIAPHRGEEPCIQGYHGSGSVFFSGCNLRCVFCQNHVCRSHGKHLRLEMRQD